MRRAFLPWFVATLTAPIVLYLGIVAWDLPTRTVELKSMFLTVMGFGLPISAAAAGLLGRPLWRAWTRRRGASGAAAVGLASVVGSLMMLLFAGVLRSQLQASFGAGRPLELQRWLLFALAGAAVGACTGLAFWYSGGRHAESS